MLDAHVVYAGINHVMAILLAVWARFDFTVGLEDNEPPSFLMDSPDIKQKMCVMCSW